MSDESSRRHDPNDSAAQLRTILDDVVEAIVTIDERGRIESVNRATESLFGYPAAEMLGQNISLLMPSPDRERHDDYLAKYLRTGEAKIIGLGREVTCRRRDGSLFPAELSVSATRLADRRVFTGILRDITARKQAEQDLRESSARLEGIVGSAMDAIITINEDHRIVLFNAAAEKMFACPAAEALGGSLDRFLPARFRAGHGQHVRSFGATGATSRTMGRLQALSALRADGVEFPIEASISQVDLGGRKLFTVILRDVTERERAEQTLAIRGRQQRAAAELSQHALEGAGLSQLIEDSVVLLPSILGVEFCSLLELEPAGDTLWMRAGTGWAPGVVGHTTVQAGPDSQAGFTLLSDEPVVVDDMAAETRFHVPTRLRECGVVSGVSAIIRGRIRPYGVLSVHTTQRRSFSGDDVHFLESVANVIAAAIERHDVEEELLEISDQEQRRIGRDLHDGLCQHLAGIEFRTEALARDLENDPSAQSEADAICALLRDGTRQARMLSRGLVPVELETNGLMSALQELGQRCLQLYRTPCEFHCARPVLLTDHMTATHLYRIAQEAVSNAVRHGRAQKIAIELAQGEDEAVLSITNDGHPLPAKPGRDGGMGLQIMHYRAEMIGARLRLSSTPDGHTTVICTFKPE